MQIRRLTSGIHARSTLYMSGVGSSSRRISREMARSYTSSGVQIAPGAAPADAVEVQERPSNIRRNVLWLMVAVYMITYMDRVVIATAAPSIQKEFNFSLQTMGWIFSAFQIGYAACQIPGGWLGDRFGARRALGSGGDARRGTTGRRLHPGVGCLSDRGARLAYALFHFRHHRVGVGTPVVLLLSGQPGLPWWRECGRTKHDRCVVGQIPGVARRRNLAVPDTESAALAAVSGLFLLR